MTMNEKELAVFESFKFNIGDIVVLTTDQVDGNQWSGMVIQRLLVQDTIGFGRYYWISSSDASGLRGEIELQLWQRPVRI